jgi:acyl carrier protein
MSTADEVMREIARICGIPWQAVRKGDWLIEHGLDSIRGIELIVALESRYGIELQDDVLADVTTVGDVIRLVEGQLRLGP